MTSAAGVCAVYRSLVPRIPEDYILAATQGKMPILDGHQLLKSFLLSEHVLCILKCAEHVGSKKLLE